MADLTASQLGGMSLIGSIGSAYTSIIAGDITAINYEMKARAKEFEAMQAKSQAEYTNLKLMRGFNELQADNFALSVAQGRSTTSGSIANMARVDQERLNWDMEFNKLSGKIGVASAMADVGGFKSASSSAQVAGMSQAMGYVQRGLIDYAKVE